MPKSKAAKYNPRNKVLLQGFDADGAVMYNRTVSYNEYHRGEAGWQTAQRIKQTGMVRLHGRIYDSAGKLEMEFDTVYSPEDGRYLGSRRIDQEGAVSVDGSYPDAPDWAMAVDQPGRKAPRRRHAAAKRAGRAERDADD